MALSNIKVLIAFVLVTVVAALILIAAPLTETEPTDAAIDMTGIWNVNLENKLAVKVDNCTAKITQTGSTLSTRILCPLIGSGINSASLTKATGDFVGSGGTSIFSGNTDGSTGSGTFSNPVINGTFTMTKKPAAPIIVVDSTVDAVDAVPGDTQCATAGAVCTLRAAIQEANALGIPFIEIIVPAGTYTLSISGSSEDEAATGDLDITTDLIISGAGADTTTVQQITTDRVFDILVGNNVFMSGLTIADGAPPAGQGGAGIRNQGNLALEDSTVRDNDAFGGGGGIYQNLATTVIVGSTINANATDTIGGGIYTWSSTLTIIDSTISGNAADGSGGGLGQAGASSVATIQSATITGNIADADNAAGGSGGGVFLNVGTSTVRNTIIAGNSSLSDDSDNCAGTWTSTGYNLIGHDGGTCTFLATTGDQVGTLGMPIDPKLGPLTDNGGPTLTHAIHADSPAIDAGDPTTPGSVLSCEVLDQTGVPTPRPQDGDLDSNAFCDIGAFEAPEPLACSTFQCLSLDLDANFFVTASGAGLNNVLCNASGAMHVALDAVGNTNGTPTKEDQSFTIDFVSGWLDCPGPMYGGSSIPSTGYIEELIDTTTGLDFPAFVTLVLCLKIDTLTPLGLVQNCGAPFTKSPLLVECTAASYDDFDCEIIVSGTPTPGFRNTLGTPVASIDASATITMTGMGELSYPADSDGDGCPDARENLPKVQAADGGGRDSLNPWDYYDVASLGGGKDGTIDLLFDILGVIQHYQPTPGGAPPYDIAFDRGPTVGPNAWNMTEPDGVIDLLNDILGVIQQYSHNC